MADIRIYNVEASQALGQYSHMTRSRPANTFSLPHAAPGDDFDAQCAGVFAQIDKALKSAGAGWGNVVQFTTYWCTRRPSRNSCSSGCANFRRCSRTAPIAQHAAHHRPPGRRAYLLEVQTVAAL